MTNLPVKISYDQALTSLKLAVMEKGDDFVYNPIPEAEADCAYFHPTTKEPSCIVGHVFAYHGITLDDVKDYNVGMSVDCISSNDIIELDDRTLTLLTQAQYHQDLGETWGASVKAAESETRSETPETVSS